MEKKHKFLFFLLIFGMVPFVHLALVMSTANNIPSLQNKKIPPDNEVVGYAWSKWGDWSPCSRTCGGGVSVQKRECTPRTKSNSTSYSVKQGSLLITLNEKLSANECLGPSQRYHECSTKPCIGVGSEVDSRQKQCSTFDSRPFRGRFYNWVPYVDGNSPCTLNCRPLGHYFYASLGLVSDGTPCTKPGHKAICVQGTCETVGKDVLAAVGSLETRCGERLVSGIFSKHRLPLGYSYVTTVPRGACRLNVSELQPSDNYIALKITNGSYIMNGEFAVSTPGSYEAVGARFVYSRNGNLDIVYSNGPLQESVDIMILFTKSNPYIKYEYFTNALTEDLDTKIEDGYENKDLPDNSKHSNKHIRRHQLANSLTNNESPNDSIADVNSYAKDEAINVNMKNTWLEPKSFVWKILAYTHCSRACGGGHQIGKYKCIEISTNKKTREVSPEHCDSPQPASHRRRCGSGACVPRWRTTPWSHCPQCGPASRTRKVGCVEDHSKGITKISDLKCPAPKPPIKETCKIPDCFSYTNELNDNENEDVAIDSFESGPIYVVSVNGNDTLSDVGSNFSAAGGWLYSEWSECVGWCVGDGIQSRGVKCTDPAGCPAQRSPVATRECAIKHTCDPYEGQWFTGDWSKCSSSCEGRQVRGVLCIGGSGRHLKDSACKGPKPESEKKCGDNCKPTWYYSDWSKCTGSCGQDAGLQRRTVWCASASDAAVSETECTPPKPPAQKVCTPIHCSPTIGTTTTVATTDLIAEESQRIPRNEVTLTTTTQHPKIQEPNKECVDKLSNCGLAVQARLCLYKYYLQSCCHSCGGQ